MKTVSYQVKCAFRPNGCVFATDFKGIRSNSPATGLTPGTKTGRRLLIASGGFDKKTCRLRWWEAMKYSKNLVWGTKFRAAGYWHSHSKLLVEVSRNKAVQPQSLALGRGGQSHASMWIVTRTHH